MSFFRGFAKFLVAFFNIILSILGIGFIVLGSLVANAFKTYTIDEVVNVHLFWGPVAGIIVLGLFLVVTSVCGIVAVLGNKSGLAKAYLALLAFIVIIEITLAVLFIVYKTAINNQIEVGIQGAIKRAYSDKEIDVSLKSALDSLQKDVKCCGSNGPDDYINATGISITHPPDSCCVSYASGCSTSQTQTPKFFQTGCKSSIIGQFHRYSTIVIAVAATFAVLEVIAIAYSMYMISRGDGEWLKAYMV
eukprot:scpid72188/ scgid23529/ Tetraspanin-5